MKTLEQIFEGYYNPLHVLSYGRPLIFSVGKRGIGKSTGWPALFIYRFIKNGWRFVYIRRDKDEVDLVAPTFLHNAEELLRREGYDLGVIDYKGGMFYMDGSLMGYAVPLSRQSKRKSLNFENVHFSFYDEFMAGYGGSRYLGGRSKPMTEVINFELLFQTIDRGIDTPYADNLTSIFVGNADTLYNPFFVAHGLDKYIRPDSRIVAPKGSCYVYENTTFVESQKGFENSNAFKVSVMTRGYSFDNEFQDNYGNQFVDKEPKGSRTAMFNFEYDGKSYGVYKYSRQGFLYVTDRPIEGRQTIILTCADHRPNTILIREWQKHPATRLVKEMYSTGRIRFRSMACKLMLDFYYKYDII